MEARRRYPVDLPTVDERTELIMFGERFVLRKNEYGVVEIKKITQNRLSCIGSDIIQICAHDFAKDNMYELLYEGSTYRSTRSSEYPSFKNYLEVALFLVTLDGYAKVYSKNNNGNNPLNLIIYENLPAYR